MFQSMSIVIINSNMPQNEKSHFPKGSQITIGYINNRVLMKQSLDNLMDWCLQEVAIRQLPLFRLGLPQG